jgi:YegS/Rv2252/BmrU family lipid kinase
VTSCVIFNPTAKGDKARRFRAHLDRHAGQCAVKLTTAAGDARHLASAAVREGFDCIIAAGGDGTVNEVLNGLAETPGGLAQSRLAVLPLGTVNVFARELRIPFRLESAWSIIQRGKERRIDLPWAEHSSANGMSRRYFAQLAGAGLDARAIQNVRWDLKKKFGPLAYIWAGLGALLAVQTPITVTGEHHSETGELILIGNGMFYGGNYRLFPAANLTDGLLDVVVLPKVDWAALARCGPSLLLRGRLPNLMWRGFQSGTLELTAAAGAPFEVDGELSGILPVHMGVLREALRVVVP